MKRYPCIWFIFVLMGLLFLLNLSFASVADITWTQHFTIDAYVNQYFWEKVYNDFIIVYVLLCVRSLWILQVNLNAFSVFLLMKENNILFAFVIEMAQNQWQMNRQTGIISFWKSNSNRFSISSLFSPLTYKSLVFPCYSRHWMKHMCLRLFVDRVETRTADIACGEMCSAIVCFRMSVCCCCCCAQAHLSLFDLVAKCILHFIQIRDE